MKRRGIAVALMLALMLPAARAWAAAWPGEGKGLLFAFECAARGTAPLGPDGRPMPGFVLRPRGLARLDAHGRLLLRDGHFIAENLPDGVLAGVTKAEAFSIEVLITPEASAVQDAVILAAGASRASSLFTLAQQGDKLVFSSGKAAATLCAVETGKTAHIVVCRGRDTIQGYKDGKPVFSGPAPDSGAPRLAEGTLRVGGGLDGAGDWPGIVEHIAVYARALTAEEAAAHAAACAQAVAARPVVPRLMLRAKLKGKSSVPTAAELAPYTQSLSVFAYEVERVTSGEYAPKTLYVAHWCVLDRTPLPFKDAALDTSYDLVLEPFSANPQLESENLNDQVIEDFSLPLYYDAGGLSLRR